MEQKDYNGSMMQSMSSTNLQKRSGVLLTKYGDRETFLKTFNPDLQIKVGHEVDRCLFGDTPTLSELNNEYGSETASMWLVLQLNSLSEFCGCKDKLTGGTLKDCSILISREYYYLKVSELLLFFYQFKCGRYGKFYGSVDPLVIMRALREFIDYRNDCIARKEQEERNKKSAEDRKNHISREQWEEIRQKTQSVCDKTKTYFTKKGVMSAEEYKIIQDKKQ